MLILHDLVRIYQSCRSFYRWPTALSSLWLKANTRIHSQWNYCRRIYPVSLCCERLSFEFSVSGSEWEGWKYCVTKLTFIRLSFDCQVEKWCSPVTNKTIAQITQVDRETLCFSAFARMRTQWIYFLFIGSRSSSW